MTRLVYRILFAAFTFLLPCAVLAQSQDGSSGQAQGQTQRQGRRGGMARQNRHMAALVEKLNLTDAQKQQFQQIGRDTRQKTMAIRQDSSLTDSQKKEKIQQLRKQSHQQMFAALTPEQKDKLKEMREQRQKENKDKDKAAPGGQAPAKPGEQASADDDPFAGMTNDDDDGPAGGF